jgi:hypothetical protein
MCHRLTYDKEPASASFNRDYASSFSRLSRFFREQRLSASSLRHNSQHPYRWYFLELSITTGNPTFRGLGHQGFLRLSKWEPICSNGTAVGRPPNVGQRDRWGIPVAESVFGEYSIELAYNFSRAIPDTQCGRDQERFAIISWFGTLHSTPPLFTDHEIPTDHARCLSVIECNGSR